MCLGENADYMLSGGKEAVCSCGHRARKTDPPPQQDQNQPGNDRD